MKKFTTLLLALCLVALMAFALVSCNNDADIESVSATGVYDQYFKDQAANFSNVKITVVYSNKKTETLTKGEADVEWANAKSDTQFILHTDGLSSMSTPLVEKQSGYKITCEIKGHEGVYDLVTAYVVESLDHDYSTTHTLSTFTLDAIQDQYNDRNGNAGKDGESYFKAGQDFYAVGDDNPFIMKPSATLLPIGGSLLDGGIERNIAVNLTVAKWTDANHDNVAQDSEFAVITADEDYSFDADTFGIQFAKSGDVVGNVYKLTMAARDYAETESGTAASVSLVVKVYDGWNAYSMNDIARMCLTTEQIKSYYTGKLNFYGDDKYTDTDLQSYEIYYNEQTHQNVRLDTTAMWRNYLANHGEKNLEVVNGIFLHNDIYLSDTQKPDFKVNGKKVQLDVVPDWFLVTRQEADEKGGGNDEAVNTFRDRANLFHRLSTDKDFVFNGNFFTIDIQNIRPCESHWANDDDFGGSDDSGLRIYKKDEAHRQTSLAIIFKFIGRTDSSITSAVKNVNFVGNTGAVIAGSASDVAVASGGLTAVSTYAGIVSVDNCIARNLLYGWYPEDDEGLKTMEIANTRTYDCFAAAVYSWKSGGGNEVIPEDGGKYVDAGMLGPNTIRNCEFKRFGGPVLFATSGVDDYNGKEEVVKSRGNYTFDDCVLESMVNGTEAWFIMNKATAVAALFTPMIEPFRGNKKVLVETGKDPETNKSLYKFNLVALLFSTDFLASESFKFESSATIDGKYMSSAHPTLQYVMNVVHEQAKTWAPTFVTSEGQPIIYNGEYTLSFSNPANPIPVENETLYGDYLCGMLPVTASGGISMIVGLYDNTAE